MDNTASISSVVSLPLLQVVMAFWDAIGGDEREVKSDTDSS